MSAATLTMEDARKCLSEAILGELDSWPDLHRRVFILAHYRGQSAETIGLSLGVAEPDVHMLLAQCDRRLRAALKDFRERDEEGIMVSSAQPPTEARGGYLF